MPSRKVIGFFRHYLEFAGGHLKHAHYYQHVQASPDHTAVLFFADGSVLDAPHPWSHGYTPLTPDMELDGLFLAGLDWTIAEQAGFDPGRKPVINLIQGFTFSDPHDPRWCFLERPATRVCVSHALAEALHATGRANGPIHVIEPCLEDHPLIDPPDTPGKPGGIFIGAMKNPALGEAVAHLLRGPGMRVDLQTAPCDRAIFLRRIQQATVTVLIPTAQEGYYLPPLEAMRLGVAVVTCDCLGNRGHCCNEDTCLIAPPDPERLAAAALRCLADGDLRAHLITRGSAYAQRQVLAWEREQFLAILQSAVI